MKNTESVIVFIPISSLDAIWEGNIKKLKPNKNYELIIDYPLDSPVKFKIYTGKNGLSFISLLKKIGNFYQKIYSNPDKYQVYGHDIEDLQLEGIDVNHTKKTIKLYIGS